MITTLDKSKINEEYEILIIKPEFKLKKRLFDLGLINGVKIKPMYKSPLSDPTAYLICGSIVALRCDDAKNIIVRSVDNGIN